MEGGRGERKKSTERAGKGELGMEETSEALKPAPHDSSTNWVPSILTYERMRAILIQTTTSAKQKIISFS